MLYTHKQILHKSLLHYKIFLCHNSANILAFKWSILNQPQGLPALFTQLHVVDIFFRKQSSYGAADIIRTSQQQHTSTLHQSMMFNTKQLYLVYQCLPQKNRCALITRPFHRWKSHFQSNSCILFNIDFGNKNYIGSLHQDFVLTNGVILSINTVQSPQKMHVLMHTL